MKSKFCIFFTIGSFLVFSCKNDLNKNDYLIPLKYCLNALDVSAKEFNSQNPYLIELAKDRKSNGYNIDKSQLYKILNHQRKIDSIIQIQKKNIQSIKNQYDDNLLCQQTLRNLDFYIYANENVIYYVELISDSIDGNEFEQASVLERIVSELDAENIEIKSNLSNYYSKYNINQIEIDSLVNLNRNSK